MSYDPAQLLDGLLHVRSHEACLVDEEALRGVGEEAIRGVAEVRAQHAVDTARGGAISHHRPVGAERLADGW